MYECVGGGEPDSPFRRLIGKSLYLLRRGERGSGFLEILDILLKVIVLMELRVVALVYLVFKTSKVTSGYRAQILLALFRI